jgi:hypothetical protein
MIKPTYFGFGVVILYFTPKVISQQGFAFMYYFDKTSPYMSKVLKCGT